MNTNYKSILVPVNFTSNVEVAVDQAVILAKQFELEIILLHVVHTSSRLLLFAREEPDQENHLREIQQQLEALEARVKSKGDLVVKTMIEKSKSVKIIARIAELFYAKFIICTHAENATFEEKKIKALEIMNVIEHTRSHVITLNGKQVYYRFSNLILPIDLTKETRQKVPVAIELAKHFESTIRLVAMKKSNQEDDYAKLVLQLKQVAKYIKSNHVSSTTDAIDLSPEDVDEPAELLQYSKKVLGDMVLVMTHQSKKDKHAIDTICRSEVPVMSVIAKNIGSIVNF